MMMGESKGERQCFICGYNNPNGLEEHHVTPKSAEGSDQPENLVWLCGSCHTALHKLYPENTLGHLTSKKVTAGGGALNMDITGYQESPKKSLDRSVPKESKHIKVEPFCIVLGIDTIDEHLEAWLNLPEWDPMDWMKGYEEYIAATVEKEVEKAREIIFSHDDICQYPISPSNTRAEPLIHIVEGIGQTWSDEHQRYHCGYCHSVFTQHEMPNLAAHLRRRHGVNEPYGPVRSDPMQRAFMPDVDNCERTSTRSVVEEKMEDDSDE